jgi:hypothetical protein
VTNLPNPLLSLSKPAPQICISYTDPASPHVKRRDALRHVYGFTCQCPRCALDISAPPPPPENQDHLRAEIESLVEVHLGNGRSNLEIVRDALAPLSPFLNGVLLGILPQWTAEFSTCSHDGPFDKALQWGNAVLGVYLLVYPGIHPLLGAHSAIPLGLIVYALRLQNYIV